MTQPLPPHGAPQITQISSAARDRPLWSVMIPTFNSFQYLQKALESVLLQDMGPEMMQIEVVDNHSTEDDPKAIVDQIGKGRVSFYRQSANLGAIANWNSCIQRSRGRIVHILHGDDEVLPGFYVSLSSLFEEYPEIGGAFCRHVYVDATGSQILVPEAEQPDSGILDNGFERIVRKQIIQCAAIAIRREAYEKLGGFTNALEFTSDWEMWIRLAAHYSVGYDPSPLAYYRVRSDSETPRIIRTGKNLADMRKCLSIAESYSTDTYSHEPISAALEHYTVWGYHTARRLLMQKDLEGAKSQWQEALKSTQSLKAYVWAALVFLDIFVVRLLGFDFTIGQKRRLPSDCFFGLRDRVSRIIHLIIPNKPSQ